MNAVGIDVSKADFTITILTGDGEYLYSGKKFEITNSGLTKFLSILRSLEGDTVTCMEYTGHYYEPVVQFLYEQGITTYVVNPLLIHRYGCTSIRDGIKKTDPLDSRKIAVYIFANYMSLKPFSMQDIARLELKMLNREFNFFDKIKTAVKNYATSLLDKSFPGIKTLFTGNERPDGHQQWVDFGIRFWHAKRVTMYTLDEFKKEYHAWCDENNYNYTQKKAESIYKVAEDAYTSLPVNDTIQELIQPLLTHLLSCSVMVEKSRASMIEVAKTMPEFPAVREIKGVTDNGAAQLIAEIGDVEKFTSIDNMVAFSGLDPGDNQSGKHASKSVRISKKGSPLLRKKLYQIVSMDYMHWKAFNKSNGPVTEFVAKKISEGKKYRVAIIAGCNKFLRRYYGIVKKYLASLAEKAAENPDADTAEKPGNPLPENPDAAPSMDSDAASSDDTVKNSNINHTDENNESSADKPCQISSDELGQKAPGKRGRPPKNTTKEQPQIVPRRRGRPPKLSSDRTNPKITKKQKKPPKDPDEGADTK